MKRYLSLLALTLVACNSGETVTTSLIEEPVAKILAYTPAPGQFINDPIAGFKGEFAVITSAAEACRYASNRLVTKDYVSLGAWGGYIVAAFSAPVVAGNDYELYVVGNPMVNSSEPGIVWVARDENGDGLANDTWYELRGSESSRTEAEGYIRNYQIVYNSTDTEEGTDWTDNRHGSGKVYRNTDHTQASYYPAWIGSNAIFEGTRLPGNMERKQIEGISAWTTQPFAWGYADNYSVIDLKRGANRFRIADAMQADGTPANLAQIDFIKIQNGICFSEIDCPIGETSTEVCAIGCYRTIRQIE